MTDMSSPAPLEPGQVIGGKYVVQQLLGQGGMGAVFLARQERLDRQVAIKVLLPEVRSNPEIVARFDREARAAASLQSDHVTRILDVGHLDDGGPYMVMELLSGEDLAETLRLRGVLPVREAVAMLVQACDAIAEAHGLGIVHRDLKPANLFLARRPNGTTTVKVLDFGISKAPQSRAGTSLTSTSAVMGSPLYMSPEQLTESRNVDARADIWALGVTMYELLTGVPPFSAPSVAEVTVLVLTTRPAPVRSRRPDVPEAIDQAVMRCLRKDPAERFAHVGDLVAALQAGLEGRALKDTVDVRATPPTLASARPSASTPARREGVPAAGERTGDPVSNTQPPEPSKQAGGERTSGGRVSRRLVVTATATACASALAVFLVGLGLRRPLPPPPVSTSVPASTAPRGAPAANADTGEAVIPTVELSSLPATPPLSVASARQSQPAVVASSPKRPTQIQAPDKPAPQPPKPPDTAPRAVPAEPAATTAPAAVEVDPFARMKPH